MRLNASVYQKEKKNLRVIVDRKGSVFVGMEREDVVDSPKF